MVGGVGNVRNASEEVRSKVRAMTHCPPFLQFLVHSILLVTHIIANMMWLLGEFCQNVIKVNT